MRFGRVFRRCGRQAKALQVDQPPDAAGPHAGITHHHVAAHAVAQQVDRLAGRDGVEQGVQVAQVVGEPVAVGAAVVAEAETAPVGGDDVARRAFQPGQRINQELERRPDVHPAMHQHQGRAFGGGLVGRTPGVQVELQAAHGQPARGGGAGRNVDRRHPATVDAPPTHGCRRGDSRRVQAISGTSLSGAMRTRIWRGCSTRTMACSGSRVSRRTGSLSGAP